MKTWFGTDYLQGKVNNTRGMIMVDRSKKQQVFRDESLERLDKYYENTQYDHLPPWELKKDARGNHLPVTSKQPKIKFPFAKNLAARVTSKLWGNSTFPAFNIVESPDDQEFIKAVVKYSRIKAKLLEPLRRAINTGSCFVRFKIAAGVYVIEWYHSKFCYPIFQDNGELESVTIKYVYDDPEEMDDQGRPKKKWYRMDLGTNSETLFDNPDFNPDEEPQFQVVEQFDHNFGFVQGEWLKVTEEHDSADGYGLISDIMEFVDELCYSMSQSSKSVSYNQDPQLVFKGVDEDTISNLIKSVTKSWSLGQTGEAEYLEAGLGGVEKAIALRDKVVQNISDFARVAIMDPEKMVGAAQSAKAMEILNGPLLDLVDEYRSFFEEQIKKLVLKLALATIMCQQMGIDVPIDMPEGYTIKSLDIEVKWPAIFKLTLDDLQKKINLANTAATGNIISRKTATRYVAEEFGIEDIEAEHAEIAAQPVFNPFGSF